MQGELEDKAKEACESKKQPAPGREFWESEQTKPVWALASNEASEYFKSAGNEYLNKCMEHPYLPQTQIQDQQLERIRELVELAYTHIAVYRDKYQAAGFSPQDLRGYDDIQKIPVITKEELIKAFPDRCINPNYDMNMLFPTRSSGSSGQTLLIRVDEDAILTDTIQGIRQFALQSNRQYRADHMLVHVYTVPWWFSSVEGRYPSSFISNVIPPDRVAQHIRELKPHILSCYPTNLEALLPYADSFKQDLYLAVTHSEASSRTSRKVWAERLGCPVLDEYSSEEATRIALELPCGHYHVCEDSVHLDILNPQTLKPQKRGESGLVVVTNLLNSAMPFIRYVQGDAATAPAEKEACTIKWSQIARIDGRMNDAFINKFGRKIPAGSLLDVTYRWMFDQDLHLSYFEITQKQFDRIEARVALGEATPEHKVKSSAAHLGELLAMCLEHPVNISVEVVPPSALSSKKRRPIRCDIQK
jgi:phenylacetate-CoA ligase